jgi:predicted DNA-binding protein (UPF0251 family)
MPRPRKHRFCRRYRADRVYKPQGLPMREIGRTVLTLDQFEALRLCDHERLDQDEAGLRMGISRGTVQRLLYSARRAVIDALLNNNAIIVNLQESEAQDVSLHPDERRSRSRRHHM